jgi:hypothetical protein
MSTRLLCSETSLSAAGDILTRWFASKAGIVVDHVTLTLHGTDCHWSTVGQDPEEQTS